MWIKQLFNVHDIRAVYTNTTTGQRVEETRLGQFFDQNTRKLVEAPIDFSTPKNFGAWLFYPRTDGNAIGEYCCDGDGLIVVKLSTDGFIRLYDQGTYVRRLKSDIDQAMVQATRYVRKHYPEIHELCLEDLST